VTYRTGTHWGVTIVREAENRRDDELVAVVVNGDTAIAERIVSLLNAQTNPECPWNSDCEGAGCSRCGWVIP
jgi:hypothetical protein